MAACYGVQRVFSAEIFFFRRVIGISVTVCYLRFPLQGDMEQAVDSYDACAEILQSPLARQAAGGEGRKFTIYLPNLHMDGTISVDEVSWRLQWAGLCGL